MRVNLKAAVLRSRRSQYEIAQASGMSETRLSRIVMARVEPSPEERKQLATVLGSDERELFDSEAGHE